RAGRTGGRGLLRGRLGHGGLGGRRLLRALECVGVRLRGGRSPVLGGEGHVGHRCLGYGAGGGGVLRRGHGVRGLRGRRGGLGGGLRVLLGGGRAGVGRRGHGDGFLGRGRGCDRFGRLGRGPPARPVL